MAVTIAELAKSRLVMTRKRFRGFVDLGEAAAEEVVVVVTPDRAADECCVDIFLSRGVGTRRDGAVDEIGLDLLQEDGLKQLLFIARTLRGSDLAE